ncbi:hypothetical protein [Xenorhabdus koppenhoeferi]|nr:hypothetical protein [Xenorhabdus sp. Vera]
MLLRKDQVATVTGNLLTGSAISWLLPKPLNATNEMRYNTL